VLWLLILRAIGLEFRAHLNSPVWTTFFDGAFGVSSALLAVFFGAALGNVIRGVPIEPDGYFFLPLWTDWRTGPHPGILDWYTVICGVLALAALAVHGAAWIALKTEGDLRKRANTMARKLWPLLVALTVISLPATVHVRPFVASNYFMYPGAMLIPLAVLVALVMLILRLRKGDDRGAFLASCAYLVAMLVGAVFALYPFVLPASGDPNLGLTIYNASTSDHALKIGLVWWSFGMCLVLGYFVFVYRMFRGRVKAGGDGHGY
jgi:cytochrome bd ubiquinol oxidase subunit II